MLAKAELAAASERGDYASVKNLQAEVNALLDKESQMWEQRARALFLKCSDRNTNYFHSKASHRFRRNRISGLRNNANVWCSEVSQIKEIAVDYFNSLFTSSNPSEMSEILDTIRPSVSEEMNSQLSKPFSREEVDIAIKEMHPIKAPGPDGMPPIFYHSFWSLIGDNVYNAVLDCLNNCKIPREINHTNITLIPKVKSPKSITKFRPISLCNVIYKLVSKVLANRLKTVLPFIISENQSAFQAGKIITDNVLMAFETLHYMKHHQNGKSGFMALKLDMSKAYDRLEWSYLEALMKRMGFCDSWVALIMECISTVSYSILVNGEPSNLIIPSRGIRQGDPLSPYLFILCTEGLHGLLARAAEAGLIRGVSICKKGPRLTHLFFADDSIVFCRASVAECHMIHKLLSCYERASGQMLNRCKTGLFFSKSTASEIQNQIKDSLGVQDFKLYEKYLGLPALVGKSKRASLDFIKERVWAKLQGWKEQLLSQTGREILLKAVVQAIPAFAMSCFKLPTSLCNEIEALIRKFWWGQQGNQRKIHWTSWKSLCKPKCLGGLGFKDLQLFNDSMLAKQVWRLLDNEGSLFHRFFKAKFFPRGSILDAKVGSGSFAWKSILKGRDVIRKGLHWRVGNGSEIRIYQDRWLPDPYLSQVLSSPEFLGMDARVSVLLDGVNRCWLPEVIDNLFLPHEAKMIKSIPISLVDCDDKIFWPLTANGEYSVKTGYKLLSNLDASDNPGSSDISQSKHIWKTIWNLNVPNRVKILIWRAGLNALPSRVNLVKRKVQCDPVCPACGIEQETTLHALWSCPALEEVWTVHFAWLSKQTRFCSNFMDILQACCARNDCFELFAIISSIIWNRRNRLRLGEMTVPLQRINAMARDSL